MLKVTLEIEKVAAILKLLGDKTRLTMMKMLETDDYCVCDFVEIFKVSQPAISQQIRKLKDLGLVEDERKGKWTFYSVNKRSEYFPFIQQILEQLPNQDDKGIRISYC